MKTIICGAGRMGKNIAEYFADENDDITLVDTDEEVLSELGDSLDVRCVIGYGTYPSVLKDAGAESADMIIAVYPDDEMNMITCMVAHNIFGVPLKIARIRNPEYLSKSWSAMYENNVMPINVLISPEKEMAKSIAVTLSTAGAVEVVPLSDGKVYLIAVRCKSDTPLIRTEMSNILMVYPELSLSPVAIVRDGRILKPYPTEQVQDKDEIYFLVPAEQTEQALSAFGYEETENQKVIITGGGRIAEYLVKFLTEAKSEYTLTVIEKDKEKAAKLADMFSSVNVINGDYLEPDILDEAGIKNANTMIALTDFDEDNVLVSLLAKRYGVGRAFALVNKIPYHNLVSNLGVDVILDLKVVTLSGIVPYVRGKSVKKSYSVRGGRDEMLEVAIEKSSRFRGKKVSALEMPKGAFFAGMLRDGQFLIPNAETVIQLDDILYIWSRHYSIGEIQKMFALKKEKF
jgi:trk system potassium uptake protein TrkA